MESDLVDDPMEMNATMPRRKDTTIREPVLTPEMIQQLLEAAWPHCGMIQDIIEFNKLDEEGMQMRAAWMGIALVVAVGLIWSVAAMSEWVPVNSAEMRSAAIPPHATTVGQLERPQDPTNAPMR